MPSATMVIDRSESDRIPGANRALGWWGLLPPVEHAGNHHWLPLSDTALVAMQDAILASSGGDDAIAAPPVVRRVSSALQRDPPLLLYGLLRWESWGGGLMVSATELAEELIRRSVSEFAGGEWLLKMPAVTSAHQQHWSRLLAQGLSRPPSRWPEDLASWLSVIGPVVQSAHAPALPRLIWDLGGAEANATDGSDLLQRAASARQQTLQLDSCFARTVEQRKNEAAKELAYGLSHEINNPLANISARAQQLEHGEEDPERSDSLRQIVQQVYRAHEMIAGLMFYANPTEICPAEVDLNQLVSEVGAEFAAEAEPLGIRLVCELVGRPAWVSADAAMIREALRILVRNSLEAIGQGGTIVISLEHSSSTQGREGLRGDALSSGPMTPDSPARGPSAVGVDSDVDAAWLLHVADSGPGLSPKAARHAFDPFYSGREAGRGLGLGLCRASRVAELHGATIRLSGGLAGCVATIALPADRPA